MGLPSMVRRNKKAIFIYLKEQIWKNIQNWSQRSLSRAGSKKNGAFGINWLKWDKMTIRKDYGDSGEQGWKLPINSSFILTRVLKDKYFPRNGFLDAKLGNSPSYTWRSIWSTIPLLTLG